MIAPAIGMTGFRGAGYAAPEPGCWLGGSRLTAGGNRGPASCKAGVLSRRLQGMNPDRQMRVPLDEVGQRSLWLTNNLNLAEPLLDFFPEHA